MLLNSWGGGEGEDKICQIKWEGEGEIDSVHLLEEEKGEKVKVKLTASIY